MPETIICYSSRSLTSESNFMIQYTRHLALILITGYCFCPFNSNGQGIHVFAEAEESTFDSLSLDVVGAATWSTDCAFVPGDFSAVGDVTFSGASDGTDFLIDGYVKYYRSNMATFGSFTFPVGQHTGYHPVIISGAIPSNAVFSNAWYKGDPSLVADPTDAATHSRGSRGPGVMAVLPSMVNARGQTLYPNQKLIRK